MTNENEVEGIGHLSKDELAIVRQIIKAWRTFEAIGLAGGFVKRLLVWFGIVGGSFMLAKGHLADWIVGLVK